MTAEDVKRLLRLEPLEREGGWFVQTYAAEEMIGAEAFEGARYGGKRRTGTAIYFLLEGEGFSEMHRLRSDEVYHFYAGDAVEMLLLREEGCGERVVIGSDLGSGARPQVVVPRGVWQGTRLVEGGGWALMGCTVSPGFVFEDYEGGVGEELCAGWPEFAEVIRELTRG